MYKCNMVRELCYRVSCSCKELHEKTDKCNSKHCFQLINGKYIYANCEEDVKQTASANILEGEKHGYCLQNRNGSCF
jgi:hypothetical protein